MAINQNVPNFTQSPPNLDNPENFNELADSAFEDLEASIIPAINTWADQANDTASAINTSEQNVDANTISASNSALSAQGSANYRGVYPTGSPYDIGDTVSGSDGKIYLNQLDNNIIDPVAVGTGWIDIYALSYDNKSVGNVGNPLSHIPLKNDLNISQGAGEVNLTRASTGSYLNRYGVIKYSAVDEPRFEKEGLLIEGSHTNYALHSEDFTDSAWIKNNMGVTTNATTAPDGELTADKLYRTAVSGQQHYIYQIYTMPITLGNDYTQTIFLEADEVADFYITFNATQFGSSVSLHVDLATKTLAPTNLKSSSLTVLANGKIRIDATATATVNDTSATIYLDFDGLGTGSGDGSSGLYVWGGQFTETSKGVSYISTTTTPSTRANDIVTLSLDGNIPAEADELTFICDVATTGGTGSNQSIFQLTGSGSVSDYYLYLSGASLYSFWAGAFISTNVSGNGRLGFVMGDSHGIIENGLIANTGVRSELAYNATTISIGSNNGVAGFIDGHISHIKIYDRALTASEIRIA